MKRTVQTVMGLATLLALGVLGNSSTSEAKTIRLQSQTHIQNIGWQAWKDEGELSGTAGKALRMEAMKIQLLGVPGGIKYQAHVQNIGWQDWQANGALAGTTGRGLRMEALRIELTGAAKQQYDVEYQAHVQNIGWMPWVKNGALAGTTGKAKRVEAFKIRLVPKSTNPEKPTTPPSQTDKSTVIFKPKQTFNYGQDPENEVKAMVEKVIKKDGGIETDYSKVKIISGLDVYTAGDNTFTVLYNGKKYSTTYHVNPYENKPTPSKDKSVINIKNIELHYNDYYDSAMTFYSGIDKNGTPITVEHGDLVVTGDNFSTKQPGQHIVTYKLPEGRGTATAQAIVTVKPKPAGATYMDTVGPNNDDYVYLEDFGPKFEQKLNAWRRAHANEIYAKYPDRNPIIELPHSEECANMSKIWADFDMNEFDWDSRHTDFGIALTTTVNLRENMSDDDVLNAVITLFENSGGHRNSMLMDFKSVGTKVSIRKIIQNKSTTYQFMFMTTFEDALGRPNRTPEEYIKDTEK